MLAWARTLPFEDKWTLYGHLQSASTNYNMCCVKMADIQTIADFWNVFNNVHSAKELHSEYVLLDNKRMIAYSLFKNDISPEWEHHVNASGSEWGCRDNITRDEFDRMWRELTLSVVNNEFEHVVGVRCINKTNKSRDMFKIEIWMDVCDERVMKVKRNIDAIIQPMYEFTLMFHMEKHSKALEYAKRRVKRRAQEIKS